MIRTLSHDFAIRFPLKDSISAVIAKYSSNGYLDILTDKWYGGLPCYNNGIEIIQPRPLGKKAFWFLFAGTKRDS